MRPELLQLQEAGQAQIDRTSIDIPNGTRESCRINNPGIISLQKLPGPGKTPGIAGQVVLIALGIILISSLGLRSDLRLNIPPPAAVLPVLPEYGGGSIFDHSGIGDMEEKVVD